uniref:G_PROTEIN_RECEP_F1_2 domain-containing protein n=1 Tax=Strongyloides papillosus TaxID=174720 RepID=A0A0N5BPZ1_STREA
MDALNNVFFSINVFLGCLFNIVAIALVVKKRNESQNKYYTFMLFLQFGMAIISTIVLGYLKMHIYVLDDFLVVFLQPLSHPLSNDFLHTGLIGFSVFLIYFNITIPTGLIASRFYIVCTNNGFKSNSVIRVLVPCITLTIIQAFGITFPFTEHVSSNIIINAIKKYNIESDILTESTVALGSKISDLKFLTMFIIVPIYFTVNYLSIIYFVKKYKLYITGHKNMISSKTQKMNKEFMTILVVQAFTPICLTGGPVVTAVILTVIKKVYIISFFINNIVHLVSFIPAVNGFLFTILLPSNRKLIILTLRKSMDTIMCKKSNQINNITATNVFTKQNSKISGSKTNSKQKRTHKQNSVKF